MNEHYKDLVTTWEMGTQPPTKDYYKRWLGENVTPAKPVTVRLGDFLDSLKEEGYNINNLNLQLTEETLNLLIYPKALSETKVTDTSIEMTVEFKAVTKSLESETMTLTELMEDLSDIESLICELGSIQIFTTEGEFLFPGENATKESFLDFIETKVTGEIVKVIETFKDHPTTRSMTFTRVFTGIFFIEFNFLDNTNM